jgi:hypothetical protein
MVTWAPPFWPVVSQPVARNMQWSKAVQLLVARKQREREKGQGPNIPLMGLPVVTQLPSTRCYLLKGPSPNSTTG